MQFYQWGVVLVTVNDADTGEVLRTSILPKLQRAFSIFTPSEYYIARMLDFNEARRVTITIKSYLPDVLSAAVSTKYEFNYLWHERGRGYR